MMETMPSLKFVISGHGKKQSIRARELESADIRSHARRVSHHRGILRRADQPSQTTGQQADLLQNGSFAGPGNVDLLETNRIAEENQYLPETYDGTRSRPAYVGRVSSDALHVGVDVADYVAERTLLLSPRPRDSPLEGTVKLDPEQKDSAPDKLGADQLIRDSWTNASIWRWGKGHRLDPFNCIPGSDQDSARIGLDFCE
jgi:hypothetical protein